MKKLLTGLLSILALAFSLFLISCNPDEQVSEGTGLLSLSLGISIEANTLGRVEEVVPLEDFKVIIKQEDGTTYETYDRYADVPDQLELPVGSYRVRAHSNNKAAAVFENPSYLGESELFTIDRGETETVSLTAELANVKITVEYSDNVTSSFETYSTEVENSLGDVLVFNETETRAGYFTVDPLEIVSSLTYTKLDGEVVVVEYSASIPNPQPKTHYQITVDAILLNGRVSINITLDESVDVIEIGIGNAGSDNDLDGFTVGEGDCDDADASIYPGATEVPNDGVDQDCNGSDLIEDVDGDGFSVSSGDCNDNDDTIFPGATEVPNDGIDQDCDGVDLIDADGDGFSPDDDCDDLDPSIYPGAPEIPNDGVDQNCDGVDLTDGDADGDNDGFSANAGDCNDNDHTIFPGAPEVPNDGIDQDCDGVDLIDADGDGYSSLVDCNDNNPFINPGANEIAYDGIDQDCNGSDLNDVDQDGFSSHVVGGPDCDDFNPLINPFAIEIPDNLVDENCDGEFGFSCDPCQ